MEALSTLGGRVNQRLRRPRAQTRTNRRGDETRVIVVILAALLIPAVLTLRTVQVTPASSGSSYSTPQGYTWSLTLFAAPLAAIIISLLRNAKVRIPRKSFFLTLALMVPAGFLLDLVFAATFLKFPNDAATLGIKFWGLRFRPLALQRVVPVEEFLFYILGMSFSLASYLWLREVWFKKYNEGDVTESVQQGKEYRDAELFQNIRVFRISASSLVLAIGLAAAAFFYKKAGAHEHHEGFPLYFWYLLGFAFIPASLYFRVVRRFINWRAVAFSMLGMLLVSLFWEACLAIPFGWWGYEPRYMMGIFILHWIGSQFGNPGLPIEAVLVWIQVTFTMVVVFEAIRLVILRRDASKRGLLLKNVLSKRSPVFEALEERERERLYRHRYQVCARRLEKNLDGIDHQELRLTVPEDTWTETRLFYVQEDKSIVASVRYLTGSKRIRQAQAYRIFELERFSAFPMESMWFIQDLVATHGRWESLKVASLLLHSYRYARTQGGLFGFCLADVGRVPHYKRLGYRIFSRNFQSPDKGLKVPMVLVGPDTRYLQRIDSPFASLAGEFPENREAVQFFENQFGPSPDVASTGPDTPLHLALFDSLNEASPDPEWVFEPEELEALREKGCLLELGADEVLIKAGSVESELYILIEGLLVAYPAGGNGIPSNWIRPGEVLGEMAYLLGDSVRRATVKSALPSKVLMVERQTLQEWTETTPALSAKFFHRMAQVLAKRLQARQTG
jgi:hypothetical protein